MAAAVVLGIGLTHPLSFWSPTLRAALETCMTLLGLATCALLVSEVRRTRRRRKALVLAALLILAPTELLANALPAALDAPLSSGFRAVLPFGQLLGALMLAIAAFTPSDRLVTARRRATAALVALSVAAVAFAELIGLLFRHSLLYDASYSGPSLSQALRLPFGFAVLLASVVFFLVAAVGFDRRGRAERSEQLSLLAGAALLLAAARIYSIAMPVVSPEEVTLREAVRLLPFGLMFVGALRHELRTRSGMARAVALSERHRVAQDLHDGLAQDLALIAAHGPQMAHELGEEHPVVLAARRALALSRGTIGELVDARSASVRDVLELVAHDAGARFGIDVVVDVQLDAEPPPAARKHVARIVREAIANAVRHGAATHVVVTLKQTNAGLALRVCDNGSGIQDAFGRRRPEGFGLTSIRERASELGGSLALSSGERGTELEVVFS